MKTNRNLWALAFGAFAFTLASTPGALASCGNYGAQKAHPTAWRPGYGQALLMPAALQDSDTSNSVSIVGMWHVVFTQKTANGATVPDSVFDNSVVVWHSDGTEIMNSSRPAQDGNFCMGVWSKTGAREYILNHIPWQGNDPTGNPQDGAQLLEAVTLSADGDHYSGKFKFVAYDDKGHVSVTLTGELKATRITTNTPFASLL